jgi:hypothetical protein
VYIVTGATTRVVAGCPSDFGRVQFDVVSCYPNCDGSTTPPILNIMDFSCFLAHYMGGWPYGNCDGSTVAPVLNVLDFGCFVNAFAAGCP